MAIISLIRGGTPVLQAPFCDSSHMQYTPPYETLPGIPGTPPYDSHTDGAFDFGHFTHMGVVNPNLNDLGYGDQERALAAQPIATGDFIAIIAMPADHLAKWLNFKIGGTDEALSGATARIAAYRGKWDNTAQKYVEAEDTDIAALLTAQGIPAAIPLDAPTSVFASLTKIVSDVAVPVYTAPGEYLWFGLTIVSLPTNAEVKFNQMRNRWYFCAKTECFEGMTHM